ncbi:MAG: hypothetical protein ACE5LD_02970 [Candidatus Bipolaricaulia bacterium]
MGEQIHVTTEEQEGGWLFRVVLTGADGSSTEHRVTLKEADYRRLTDTQKTGTSGKVGPERLVEQSFRFLLEREPKEAILKRFDLTVISRYFPEYEGEIARRLGS